MANPQFTIPRDPELRHDCWEIRLFAEQHEKKIDFKIKQSEASVKEMVSKCKQAEKNMSRMMLQWEGAITTMEVRMGVIEKMFKDLKKMLEEAAAIRDDMNYFLSLVKIPSEHGKEEEV